MRPDPIDNFGILLGIRLDSDRDRRTLTWLRRLKSDDEIQAAAQTVADSGRRVYVSNVVKQLGLAEVVKLAQLEQEPQPQPARPEPGQPGPEAEAARAREKLRNLAQEYRARIGPGGANKRI